jgi:hypothetical protein
MKTDTLDFINLPFAKHFNFPLPGSGVYKRGDPFLIQCSIDSGAGGAGMSSLRGMRKSKSDYKIVIPLRQEEMQKAKACEEMIMFEKPENEQG